MFLPFLGKLGTKTTKLQTDIATLAEKIIAGSTSGAGGDGFTYDLKNNSFSLKIKDNISILNTSIANDLGVDGLALSMDGKINGNVDYNLILNGGWDTTNGVFINQSSSNFTSAITFDANNLQFNGMLGPLSVSAVDQPSKNSNGNKTIGDTGANLSLNLKLKNDSDGKLSVGEAADIVNGKTAVKDAVDISVKGDAQLSFGVTTKADLPAAYNAVEKYIPTYTFDFTAPFQFQYNAFQTSSASGPFEAKVGDIYLDNTRLNISQFVLDEIQPVVNSIDGFLKPLFPVADTLLKGQQPWDISGVGDSLAASLSAPLKRIPLAGDKIASVMSGAITGVSQNVEDAYKEIFKSLDGLSAYNQQTPYVKDNLISPYELVRSSANLLYNLAYDRDNTIKGIENTAEASMKKIGIADVVITATKAAISSLFDQYAPDTQTQKDYATTLKTSVDTLGDVLTTIQKFERLVADVKQFDADGAIELGSYNFKVGSNIFSSAQSINSNTFVTSVETHPVATTSIPDKFNALITDMKSLGFGFPALSSIEPLVKTIALQQADFITYKPNLPTITIPEVSVPFSVLAAFGIPPAITDLLGIKVDLLFKNSATLGANLSFGADNQGIIDWAKSGYSSSGLTSLLDGFYMRDLGGPEFKLDMTTKLGAVGSISTPGFKVAGFGVDAGLLDVNANAFLRLLTGIGLDVKDSGSLSGTADGKVRPSEIVSFIANGELPFDIAASLNLYADLAFKGVLDTKKIPGPDFIQPTITIGSSTPTEFPLGSYSLLI